MGTSKLNSATCGGRSLGPADSEIGQGFVLTVLVGRNDQRVYDYMLAFKTWIGGGRGQNSRWNDPVSKPELKCSYSPQKESWS